MAKKKDKIWDSHPIGRVYVGHKVQDSMIYIGGAYYQDHAQVHLTIAEAKWLKKYLNEAIKRTKKGRRG